MPIAKKSKIKKSKPVAPAAKTETKPASTTTGESGMYEGYCVKCKEKNVKFQGEVHVNDKGMMIAKGPHTSCGTTVCRILGKQKTS
jgi:hypothetical protein